jgi:hypothetical protein
MVQSFTADETAGVPASCERYCTGRPGRAWVGDASNNSLNMVVLGPVRPVESGTLNVDGIVRLHYTAHGACAAPHRVQRSARPGRGQNGGARSDAAAGDPVQLSAAVWVVGHPGPEPVGIVSSRDVEDAVLHESTRTVTANPYQA